MTLDDVEILTGQQVKEIFYDVYNGFWRKWRDNIPEFHSAEWDKIVEHEKRLRRKYRSCPLVVHMIQDLMDQLEARSRKQSDR